MRNFGLGIIGCGTISEIYFQNTALFKRLKLIACADIVPAAAHYRAMQFGVEALDVETLLNRDDVDIIVNLTVPSAHFDISLAALRAGKHVFTEKPICTTAQQARLLVALAKEKNLQMASAPDTFLGAGGQMARHLLDSGKIGRPVMGTAFLMGHGMENWHPNPEFFFKPGGGPVLDMGPYYITTLVNMLGACKRVTALTSIGQENRVVTAAGPHLGQIIKVETPTTAMALLEFNNGTHIVMTMSWDVWRHSCPAIEIHCTEGSLKLPDPNFYGGEVHFSLRGKDWQSIATTDHKFGKLNQPAEAPEQANYRALGIAELAAAIENGDMPRASGDLALHVLEVLEAILESGQHRSAIDLPHRDIRPPVLTEIQAENLAI